MDRIDTPLKDACVIEPRVFGDNRGWFFEAYSCRELARLGIDMPVVQTNRSYSAQKGTLRGLHCQTEPMAQAKLVSCVRGAIADVIVDVREGSPTFLQWFRVELTAENKRMLYVPRGFLHSFLTLTADVEAEYKVDNYYSPEHDRSIRFDDPAFGIEWGVTDPVLSEKDRNAPFLKDSDIRFIY